MKTAVLTTRIDSELKNEAGDLLKKMGLTHSCAISLFYNEIRKKRKMPFMLEVPSVGTLESLKEIKQGRIETSNSVEELMEKLNGDKEQ